MKSISIIGGDARQITVYELFKANGFPVTTWGLGLPQEEKSLETALTSEVLLFPMPMFSANGLNAPLSSSCIQWGQIFPHLKPNQLILAGKIPPAVAQVLNEQQIQFVDYLTREELAVKNAVPTAEGAIEIAMSELPVTLHGSQCLIIGYGRIGRILARMLHGFGAFVTVAARRCDTLAWIEADGYTPLNLSGMTDKIHSFDVVFNTAPAAVLTEDILVKLNPQSLIIDLASKPGGVDFEAAKRLNKRVIWALSLPGKVAPCTSGKIIHDTVLEILKETC